MVQLINQNAGALLGPTSIGQISKDLQEAVHAVALDWNHFATGPEKRAVLARVPPLVVGPANPTCPFHLLFRPTVGNIVLGKENPEMLAQCLLLGES